MAGSDGLDDLLGGGSGSGSPGGGEMCSVEGGDAPTFAFAGNPIDLTTGNKFQIEQDFRGVNRSPDGFFGLEWTRYYNSHQSLKSSGLGNGWRHHYQRTIQINDDASEATVLREDGHWSVFEKQNDQWRSRDYDIHQLKEQFDTQGQLAGYQYQRADGVNEHYDLTGRLLKLRHYTGATQSLFYNDQQQLTRIVDDTSGTSLSLRYSGESLIGVDGPDQFSVSYQHNDRLNLISVSYGIKSIFFGLRQKTSKTYHYENTRYPTLLTGITDEAGERVATWAYDERTRAISSEHGDGAEKISLAYNDDGTVSLTNAMGKTSTYHFVEAGGRKRTAFVDGEATSLCADTRQQHRYASDGYLKATIDAEGNAIIYERNKRGLITVEKRGYRFDGDDFVVSDAAVQIKSQWHPTLPLVSEVIYQGRKGGEWTETLQVDNAYTAQGRLLSTTYTDLSDQKVPYPTKGTQRTYRYSYEYRDQAKTQLSTVMVNGPRQAENGRDDITTYDYDAQGNLTAVTNALGHRMEYGAHTALGLPQRIRDANGTETRLDYNHRGWLTAITQRVNDQPVTTRLDYYENGLVKSTHLPDGSEYHAVYNAARQLTKLTNDRGERITFTVNPLNGEWSEVSIIDGEGNTIQSHQRQFDELGRVVSLLGNQGQCTTLAYDRNNNMTAIHKLAEANGSAKTNTELSSSHSYYQVFDHLNRLSQTIDPAQGKTRYAYSPQGKVASVTDANGAVTRYTYNGFGQVIQVDSPDTGIVIKHYDEAGNLIRSQRRLSSAAEPEDGGVTSHYDMLNRLVKIDRDGAANDVHYRYDQSGKEHGNGIGRLTHIKDGAGTIDYQYDQQGNITQDARNVLVGDNSYRFTTNYSYNAEGKLSKIIYPGGDVVRYSYDKSQLVNISKVTPSTDENESKQVQPLISEVRYRPFGQAKTWQYGNGLTRDNTLNLDGRLTHISVGDSNSILWSQAYQRDVLDNIQSIRREIDGEGSQQAFRYDELGRLINEEGSYGHQSYQYDPVGNRISQTMQAPLEAGVQQPSVQQIDYDYHPNSNRLVRQGDTKLVHDIAGNHLGSVSPERQERFVYNPQNRLASYYVDGQRKANYGYNSLGQRVFKQVNLDQQSSGGSQQENKGITVFHYDQKGQLLGESILSAEGIEHKNYVWFNRQPVAQLQSTKITYLHTDHLNTPRLATNSQQQPVWQWQSDAFGLGKPNNDVDGDGQLTTIPLRFPGQYHDQESDLFYNYYRTYDPALGRYTQSDPIGLRGG